MSDIPFLKERHDIFQYLLSQLPTVLTICISISISDTPVNFTYGFLRYELIFFLDIRHVYRGAELRRRFGLLGGTSLLSLE